METSSFPASFIRSLRCFNDIHNESVDRGIAAFEACSNKQELELARQKYLSANGIAKALCTEFARLKFEDAFAKAKDRMINNGN